ncbi:class I SAM-dependent methyltransferase [Methanocorpusculum sp. MG]|uniref:Class I SAM-dependent methyltransferase n=1 Tax=Methanocorpusculum petauri TaxID=3002863 RepID=A0ABT4IGU0_9EURY|nr:class I SAM-dependent methyltransferase [Methanocorpusculum petauri]MCZ0860954.1 class I SAM-dependent methyltransferase [Methanocorpusculum petauri]
MMEDSEIKQGIIRKWDTSADQYDLHVSHGVKTEEEKQLWMDAFRTALPQGTLRILDVGCGTGAMGLILAEMGHEVLGIDLSEGMMDVGRKKNEKCGLSMIFQKGDAEHPPFADDSFDVVVNRHLLWTLPHPDTALASWKRIIHPGGRIIVIDGVWDDGKTTTKIRREVSNSLGKIFDPLPAPAPYTAEVSSALPNLGGVPEYAARRYFADAGLADVTLENLMHIRDLQRKQLNWYQKISHHWCYYLISGTKEV